LPARARRLFNSFIKLLRPSRRLVLLCVLLLCALIAFVQRDDPQLPPVTILDEYKTPITTRDRFRKTLGPNRNWVNRAEETFFGKRKSATIATEVIRLRATLSSEFESALNLGRPTYNDTNGFKVWFLGPKPLKQFRGDTLAARNMEVVSRPRLYVADGMGASMHIGQAVPGPTGMANIGFGIQCSILIRDDSTEMMMNLENSYQPRDTTIHTNLDINVRLNIPNGKGVLLVQLPDGYVTNGWAVVIGPLN
jgi:hypothetical protein